MRLTNIWALKLILLLTILVSTTTKTAAQLNPSLDNYSISQSNGQVYLYWVLSAGFTCDGIRIYRATDTTQFNLIGTIPGICGSPDFAIGFDFVDENPVPNTINYYRLELGNFGFTAIISIKVFDLNSSGFLLFTDPVSAELTIVFENQVFDPYRFQVFNLHGQIIDDIEGNQASFEYNTMPLAPGTYVFAITNRTNGRTFMGKFVVGR